MKIEYESGKNCIDRYSVSDFYDIIELRVPVGTEVGQVVFIERVHTGRETVEWLGTAEATLLGTIN